MVLLVHPHPCLNRFSCWSRRASLAPCAPSLGHMCCSPALRPNRPSSTRRACSDAHGACGPAPARQFDGGDRLEWAPTSPCVALEGGYDWVNHKVSAYSRRQTPEAAAFLFETLAWLHAPQWVSEWPGGPSRPVLQESPPRLTCVPPCVLQATRIVNKYVTAYARDEPFMAVHWRFDEGGGHLTVQDQ